MASTPALLLQLLLVSLASASHHFGGTATFTYKGRNPDGTFKVDIRNRATYDGCQYSHYWNCYSGNCGQDTRYERGVLDRSTNAPQYNSQWCETETVIRRHVPSDKPFQMSAASCCWIPTRNWVNYWNLLTHVDLGTRSDTGKPNRSPDIAILPFLRVPQNCPRTYKLISFDPDGDQVRCRYGSNPGTECSGCDQPSGFHLDQGSCTLHYNYASADPSVYGFEMVVEDFPKRSITVAYTDGSRSLRAPLTMRRKRTAPTYSSWYPTTTAPWWWYTTTAAPTTTTTTAPTTIPWWWWWHTSTAAPATTTTAAPTTITTPTTIPWWWWWQTSTAAPTTTTTAAPTTITTTAPTTIPWWWWWQTSTAAPTTTTTAAPTTIPWWWWWHTSTAAPTTTTTTAPTTTSWWWYTTTTPEPTTTTPIYTTTTTHLHASTAPLSKLPLQFSLLVDPAAPSCQEGLYLPKFVSPTPKNGEHIQAEVNKEVEIKVKAQASYATIHNIIISGPLNISKHQLHDEFVIRWTPTVDDLGDHYAICFAVEAVTGAAVTGFQTTHHSHYHPTLTSQSGIYQSEMRCVVVDIGKKQVEANVICTESTMRVEVEKSSFAGLHEDHLRLSDSTNTDCSLQRHSNSTHIIAVIPLNACGTQIEEDEDNLMFKNEITTVDNSADLITRKHLLEVQFYCQYPKRGNVTLGFTAHRKNITVWEKGFGTFTYQFEFYPNGQFETMIDPDSYPLEYNIGDRIYMQIEATSSSVNNTELFVESCTAAPYDNPNYWPTYPIIENGCKVDSTVKIHSSDHKGQFRFCVEAFKFIGLHDQVYISCSVMMCVAGDSGTRCSQGCINSTWSGGHHHRRKREVVSQTARHLVSQGPLRLKRSLELTERPMNLNLNLNLVFIAGCLLAAVGMISAVAVYKAKVSGVKYQPLPAFES